MTIRVLVVDDHEIFADGLCALLGNEPDLEIVGKITNGREAVRMAVESVPDAVVMDISMPGMNGIEATREIRAQLPSVNVICLSMHAERRFVQAALDAGASGYLLKDCALNDVVQAVRAVMAGQVYLSPAVTGTVVEALKDGRSEADASVFSILTDRERAVLQLLAEGQSSKEIAAHLEVSVKTVGSHREHVMNKLGIHTVAGLTKYAIREGLTSS